MHVHTYTCTYIRMHLHTYACTYVCMYVRTYVRTFVLFGTSEYVLHAVQTGIAATFAHALYATTPDHTGRTEQFLLTFYWSETKGGWVPPKAAVY